MDSAQHLCFIMMLLVIALEPQTTQAGAIVGVCPRPNLPEADYDGDIMKAAPGTVLIVKCKESYLERDATIICQNGTWSEPKPPCTKVYCQVPEYPNNSNMTMPCQEFNCSATVWCNEGYWYNGTTTRFCKRDESWTGVAGQCLDVECPLIKPPLNGRINQTKRYYRDEAELMCDEGYFAENTSKTCQDDNTWSGHEFFCDAIECPELPSILHGEISQPDRSYQGRATVTCDEGYVYSNPNSTTRQCQGDNTWSGELGTCKIVECPELPSILHGEISQPDRSYQGRATVTCDEGYVYSNPNSTTRQCQGDNTWSGEQGTCEKIRCPKLTAIENGILSGEENRYLDKVILQCHSGHILDGPSKVTCQASGNWSTTLGRCRKPVENYHVSSNSLHPAIIFLICLLVIVSVVFGIIFLYHCYHKIFKTRQTSHGEEDLPFLNQSHHAVHCSFILQEDFSKEYPEVHSPEYQTFAALIRRGIMNAIRTVYQHDVQVNISYICKRNRRCFVDLEAMNHLEKGIIIDKMSIVEFCSENGEHGKWNVAKGSVVFHEKALHLILIDVHRRGHVKDKVNDQTIDLETQYVKLKLLSNEELDVMKTGLMELPDHYQYELDNNIGEDVEDEDLLSGTSYGKYILIRGRAGIGKSTLVQRLLWKWANGDWAHRFKVILILNLRCIMSKGSSISLGNLLSLYSVYNTCDTEVVLDSDWFQQNQSEVGIMLDGLDEVPGFRDKWVSYYKQYQQQPNEDLASPLDWCFGMLTRKYLPDSTLIVTSRPFADLGMIVQTLRLEKLSQSLTLIELMGLTRERVMEFIGKNVQIDRRDFVRQTMLNNPVLLSVSSITFYCAALCQLLVKEDTIPSRLTTYTQITAYIMQLYIQRSTVNATLLGMKQHIRWLSKLALLGIKSDDQRSLSRLIFCENDIKELDEKGSENIGQSGLLLQTEILDPVNNKPEVISQFVHLSIQEFLAMAGLLNCQPNKAVEKITGLLDSDHFSMARLFVYGLAFSQDNDEVRKIAGLDETLEPNTEVTEVLRRALLAMDDNLQALQIAHESQSVDMVQMVGKQMFQNEVKIEGYKMTVIDVIALVFMLKNNHSIHSVQLKHVELDLVSVNEFGKFLKKSTNIEAVKVFDNFDDKRVEAFMDAFRINTKIHTLHLTSDAMTDKSVDHIAAALEANKSVKYLVLDCNKVTDEGMSTIIRGLESSSILEEVSLLCTNMTDNELLNVARILIPKRNLIKLKLRCRNMTDRGVADVARSMKQQSWLKELRLLSQGAGLTDEGVREIADALAGPKPTLEKLEFQSRGITDKGVMHMAKAIASNRSLKELSFLGFHMQEEGARAILEMVATKPKIRVWVWPLISKSEGKSEIWEQMKSNRMITIV